MNPRIPPSEIGLFYPTTYYTTKKNTQQQKKETFRHRLKISLLAKHFGYPNIARKGLADTLSRLIPSLLLKTPPMRRQISWVPNGRVLDVGCGNGEMLDQYRALGWRTTGVEPGANSAELARNKGHTIITGLVEETGLAPESFDAITLWDALEHVPNPGHVVRELFRILAPSGKIYIHVPNYGSFYAKWWQDKWFMFTAPLHYYHYTSETISYLLDQNGFKNIRVSTGIGEVGWRQSVISGATNHSIKRRFLQGGLGQFFGNVIEQILPGGHLTAIASKPTRSAISK
jgi:2-polyprenyl-3-methyl-5-hydroxy-6-metoxy-1,4-benzoquinol methylase